MPDAAQPYVLRSWDDTDWINQVPEDLYPRRIPARLHLGTADGCQWNGPGYHYEPWGTSDELSLAKCIYSSSALRTAGNAPRPLDGRTALYRLNDAAGDLLYIGISREPLRRWGEHADDKWWWGDVSHFSLQWLPSRRAALTAECRAIRSERPKYNIVHNQSPAA